MRVFVLFLSFTHRAPSRCLCFSGFWDLPHYPSPSCFGAPNAEKPRLHEPHIGLPTDLKVIPVYRSPAREICFLDRLANRASSRLRPPLEDGKLYNFGVSHSCPGEDSYQFPFVLLTIINFFFFREKQSDFVCFLVGMGETVLGVSAFFFRFRPALHRADGGLVARSRPGPTPYVSAPPRTPSAARAAAVCNLPVRLGLHRSRAVLAIGTRTASHVDLL